MFNPSMASVSLVPDIEKGRGYGAEDLHMKHLDRVRDALGQMNPDLKLRAIKAWKAVEVARLDLETIQVEIRRACGDLSPDAMLSLQREASVALAKEQVAKASEPEPVKPAKVEAKPEPVLETEPDSPPVSLLEKAEAKSNSRKRN